MELTSVSSSSLSLVRVSLSFVVRLSTAYARERSCTRLVWLACLTMSVWRDTLWNRSPCSRSVCARSAEPSAEMAAEALMRCRHTSSACCTMSCMSGAPIERNLARQISSSCLSWSEQPAPPPRSGSATHASRSSLSAVTSSCAPDNAPARWKGLLASPTGGGAATATPPRIRMLCSARQRLISLTKSASRNA